MKHLGAAAGIVVVLAGAGSAGGASNPPPAKEPKTTCSWGASSVTARFENGRWIVGAPTVTGCAP
jgi:hypothetical protein